MIQAIEQNIPDQYPAPFSDLVSYRHVQPIMEHKNGAYSNNHIRLREIFHKG